MRVLRAAALVVALVLGALGSRVYNWAAPADVPRVGEDGCVVGDPMRGVYIAPRLNIRGRCVTATGTVHDLAFAEDGDVTFDLSLDPGQGYLVNEVNVRTKHGRLHLEIIPLDRGRLSLPREGEHIVATGVWVEDLAHGGHLELHPVTAIAIR